MPRLHTFTFQNYTKSYTNEQVLEMQSDYNNACRLADKIEAVRDLGDFYYETVATLTKSNLFPLFFELKDEDYFRIEFYYWLKKIKIEKDSQVNIELVQNTLLNPQETNHFDLDKHL